MIYKERQAAGFFVSSCDFSEKKLNGYMLQKICTVSHSKHF